MNKVIIILLVMLLGFLLSCESAPPCSIRQSLKGYEVLNNRCVGCNYVTLIRANGDTSRISIDKAVEYVSKNPPSPGGAVSHSNLSDYLFYYFVMNNSNNHNAWSYAAIRHGVYQGNRDNIQKYYSNPDYYKQQSRSQSRLNETPSQYRARAKQAAADRTKNGFKSGSSTRAVRSSRSFSRSSRSFSRGRR